MKMGKKLIMIVILLIIMVYILRDEKIKKIKIKFPFLNILDEKGNKTEFMLITGWFFDKDKEKMLKQLRRNYIMIGICSYQDFPRIDKNIEKHEYWKEKINYEKMSKSWLHCFRNPGHYFKETKHLKLLSHSDFVNYKSIVPNKVEIKYDYIYSVQKDGENCEIGWHAKARNWELGQKCIPIMYDKFKLKGVIIGRKECELDEKYKNFLEFPDFLPWGELQNMIDACRFLFVPNVLDASPRLAIEAMCKNKPVLMNVNILGGWKYIEPGVSGEFFTDEKDLEVALSKILRNYDSYKPREHFVKNFGEKAPKELQIFLAEKYPKAKKYKELHIAVG